MIRLIAAPIKALWATFVCGDQCEIHCQLSSLQAGRHFRSERTGQTEGLARGEAWQKEHVFMKWRHRLPVTHACAHTQRCVSVTQHWLEQTGVEVLVRWGLLEEVSVCVCVCDAGKLLGHDKGWALQGSCSRIWTCLSYYYPWVNAGCQTDTW